MVVRRSRKVRKQRGGRSHGWGVVKDHKGSGMSGGKGNAGRMSHKWLQYVIREKETGEKALGQYGFKRPQQFTTKYSTINTSHLDQSIDSLVNSGKASKDGDVYQIDLNTLGITKLLAQGDISRKINITVKIATERAIKKVTESGGKVILPE
ncbi:MAG: 50S ribosomal protein L15 [Candidatus Heimdallarchaeota archaeon]|nr:50S ribosomal protein L15 [Candidatus Heimdallarchaeota archaeon]MDH5644596.1 50S ribosomal protein L15 [Candidatus Heimdallarchaeota archaeon]